MPYERATEIELADGVAIRFGRSGRPITRYAVVLLVRVDGAWREARVFDNHQGSHHMHRYTRTSGEQPAEQFHPGPTNLAIAAAIAHLKDHWEAIAEQWMI